MTRDPTLKAMRWVVIGVAALLVGLLAYGVAEQGAEDDRDAPRWRSASGRRTPPSACRRSASDATGTVDDYRGQVVLVNFWGVVVPAVHGRAAAARADAQGR